jgi:NAD+ kinase
MAKSAISKVSFYHRDDNPQAAAWREKIEAWLQRTYPKVRMVKKGYQALLVLGGDGTILEAARECRRSGAVIVGLNLGTVGFLASARRPPEFLSALEKFFAGKYNVSERIVIHCEVFRKKRRVFTSTALNELVIMNPLGMVDVEARINGHAFQNIAGTGVMVATPTGSTAYNISAHGPVVMPDSRSFILTEILDHNIPTPSLVLDDSYKIDLHIQDFRRRELLSVTKTKKKVDVLFIADGEILYPLEKGDIVKLDRAEHTIKLAEFEKNYFLKSLQEKFAFK